MRGTARIKQDARRGMAKHGKARQGKARQWQGNSKARQGKTRQDKTRQGKARRGASWAAAEFYGVRRGMKDGVGGRAEWCGAARSGEVRVVGRE